MNGRHSVITAAKAAKHWLLSTDAADDEMTALRTEGLKLCEHVLGEPATRVRATADAARVDLPPPVSLIALSRFDLLDRALRITRAETHCAQAIAAEGAETWARVLGGLALSYAQTNDLEVVSALILLAAHLKLDCRWLDEARSFLLEQQQPSGCFGMISAESVIMRDHAWSSYMALKLTVAAVAALASFPPMSEYRSSTSRRSRSAAVGKL